MMEVLQVGNTITDCNLQTVTYRQRLTTKPIATFKRLTEETNKKTDLSPNC